MLQKALEIQEKMPCPEHSSSCILDIVDSLGSSFLKHGEYKEAETMHQRALQIREEELGSEHPDTLISLDGLASVFACLGKYDEAEAAYRWAFGTRKRVLGP